MANELTIEVFDKNFVPLGNLERHTGLRWLERFTSYGEFELWCPITELNTELIKEDNYIWINESTTAGVIEYIEKSKNENNEKELHVKGRHLVAKLRGRVIYPTFNGNGQISAVMKKQVEQYCIRPQNVGNKLEMLEIANEADFGDTVSYQQTGSDLLEEQLYLCEANNVGVRIDLDYNRKKMVYRLLNPANRTWNQSILDPVVFDSRSDEILSSNYTANKSEVCNVAIVAGEGEGSARKVIEVQEGFYPITNLVTNGSFETGDFTGWSSVRPLQTIADDMVVFGSKSCKFNGELPSYYWSNNELTGGYKSGHIFYSSVWCRNDINTGWGLYAGNNGKMELNINTTHDVVPSVDRFVKLSKYNRLPQSDKQQINLLIYGAGGTAVTGTSVWDGALVVDLTATFGAGNEPSKEWCDKHISYFEGTIYISKNGYVANNLVKNASFENDLSTVDKNQNNFYKEGENAYVVRNIISGDLQYASFYGGQYVLYMGSETPVNSWLVQNLFYKTASEEKFYVFVKYNTGARQPVGAPIVSLARNDNYNQFGFIQVSSEPYVFTKDSAIFTVPQDMSLCLICFGYWTITWDIQIDDIIVVPLTRIFGEGNEPTKEWCDKNIPFFEGTKVIGEDIVQGEQRKELWVDARDLQSTDENDMSISDAEYNRMLWQRGLQKLSDYKPVENFNSVIKAFGFQQYEYNKDYFLGDYVTVVDAEIGITMDTQITEVERIWDEKGYQFTLTFGKTQPTILDVAKRAK